MTRRKNTKYMAFIEYAKSVGGIVRLDEPHLETLLGPMLPRIANYIWQARTLEKLEVNAIRRGKTVIAYEFPAFRLLSSQVPYTSVPPVGVPEPVGQ